MSTLVYCHNETDAHTIQRYITNNNILPDLNSKLYNSEKPQQIEVKFGTIILNDENPDIHHNALQQSQDHDNLIATIERVPVKAIEEITDRDTTIHLPELELSIHEVNDRNKNVIDAITKHSEGGILRLHRGGRPPLGCDIKNGYVTKADNYRAVRETLARHVEGSISKEEAADRLDTTPRTIERARDRDELYRIK